jgi:hypothetical protein
MTDSISSNTSSSDYFKDSEKTMKYNPGSYIPNTDSMSSLSDDSPYSSDSEVEMESVDIDGERKEVPANEDELDEQNDEEGNNCCKSCLLTCFSPCAMLAIVGGIGCYVCCNRS